jgi:hypothetical protein
MRIAIAKEAFNKQKNITFDKEAKHCTQEETG